VLLSVDGAVQTPRPTSMIRSMSNADLTTCDPWPWRAYRCSVRESHAGPRDRSASASPAIQAPIGTQSDAASTKHVSFSAPRGSCDRLSLPPRSLSQPDGGPGRGRPKRLLRIGGDDHTASLEWYEGSNRRRTSGADRFRASSRTGSNPGERGGALQ